MGERSPGPPSGPPWDLPVTAAPLAFVDLEMTGLDPERDHVVEICVERWVGDVREDAVDSLVRPPARAGGASHVHGLDEATLRDAPRFAALAPSVLRILDGAVLVAHAAKWDIAFLEAEMRRAQLVFESPFALDTLVLARRSFALRSYALPALAQSLGIAHKQAHRAASDVEAMRGVFARCLTILAPVNVRDLWEVRVAERQAREAIVLACTAAVEHAHPVTVTYRPARRAPQDLQMVLTEVRSDLDPPRVMGYQLPGRGRRELRADRILRVEAAAPTGSS